MQIIYISAVLYGAALYFFDFVKNILTKISREVIILFGHFFNNCKKCHENNTAVCYN